MKGAEVKSDSLKGGAWNGDRTRLHKQPSYDKGDKGNFRCQAKYSEFNDVTCCWQTASGQKRCREDPYCIK